MVLNSGDGVVFTAAAASVNDAVRVYGTVDTSDDPATLRLEVAWSDASNNLWGEVDVDTTVWTIKVGRRLAGVDTDYVTALTIDAPTMPAVACLSWEPGEVQTPESYILSGLNGTIVEDPSAGWTNDTNILTDNGSETTYNFGAVGTGTFINVYGFPVSLPPGSTIDGISVGIEARRSPSIGTALEFETVRLIGDWSYNSGASDNIAAATSIAGTATLYGFGGTTNTWGITDLSWEHVNNPSTFGVQIALKLTTGPTGGQGLIDYVQLDIYYTTPERQPGRLRLSLGGACITEYAAESPAAGLKAGIRSTGGDWDVADLSYEYLLSASRPTCGECDCTGGGSGDAENCDECCVEGFPPKAGYVVDLGAGGWTGDSFDECPGLGDCPDAAGEIEVSTADPCHWNYFGPANQCDAASPRLEVTVVLAENPSGGQCQWRATIKFATGGPADWPTAYYASASIATNEDCATMPVTLNKVSENNQNCGGTLPATITIDDL